jgi:hypothetical protein
MLNFMQVQRKKPSMYKLGDPASQVTHPFLPNRLPHNFCSKMFLPLCQNLEVPCHVSAIFMSMLQQGHPLNTEVIHCLWQSVRGALKCPSITFMCGKEPVCLRIVCKVSNVLSCGNTAVIPKKHL